MKIILIFMKRIFELAIGSLVETYKMYNGEHYDIYLAPNVINSLTHEEHDGRNIYCVRKKETKAQNNFLENSRRDLCVDWRTVV
jgi:hypothetical protein